ncbi:MAG TPA: dipeptidase [Acetobacteraceae bacterium]|nr:dipeptidase [Acetobacteraceae bacterium]
MTANSEAAVDAVLAQVDKDLDQARGRLFDLLHIPSISTQPEHEQDVRHAAEWFRDQLAGLGFKVAIEPTAGHPVVLGRYPGPAGTKAPRILFYGHYDVQPPDPLELWHSPPFEPQLVDGPHGPRIVARGAVDAKGQTMMFIEALRAWKAVGGGIPAPVTVLVEGEEEVGSPNLEPFLVANKDALAAEFALISDTNMWDIDTPGLTTRLRGMCNCEVTLKGPSRDLHSGLFGGSALNPINVLTRILGELQDDQGRIQVPGFYDAVRSVSKEQQAEWQALGFDETAFLRGIGLATPGGEHGVPALQRLWTRPTADINGIWGGYSGPGSKTIIPSEASAKVSFRLVPDQDAQAVFEGFQRFVADRLPPGMQVSFEAFGMAPGIEIATDTPWVEAARTALQQEYGRPAVMIGSGGTIPVVEQIKRTLNIDSLMMGFGLEDDQIHSPNEKFELRCFHKGTRSHARLLGKLAESG